MSDNGGVGFFLFRAAHAAIRDLRNLTGVTAAVLTPEIVLREVTSWLELRVAEGTKPCRRCGGAHACAHGRRSFYRHILGAIAADRAEALRQAGYALCGKQGAEERARRAEERRVAREAAAARREARKAAFAALPAEERKRIEHGIAKRRRIRERPSRAERVDDLVRWPEVLAGGKARNRAERRKHAVRIEERRPRLVTEEKLPDEPWTPTMWVVWRVAVAAYLVGSEPVLPDGCLDRCLAEWRARDRDAKRARTR